MKLTGILWIIFLCKFFFWFCEWDWCHDTWWKNILTCRRKILNLTLMISHNFHEIRFRILLHVNFSEDDIFMVICENLISYILIVMIIGIVQITYHVIEIIMLSDKMYVFPLFGKYARITLSSLKCHLLYIFTASYLKWYCVSENRGTSRITSSFFCSRTNRGQDWLCSFQSHSYRQRMEPANVVILQLICCSWVIFIKSDQFVSCHRLRAEYVCIKSTAWLHFCKIDYFTVLQLGNFNKLIICRNSSFILYRKNLNDWSDDIHEWIMFFTILLQNDFRDKKTSSRHQHLIWNIICH